MKLTDKQKAELFAEYDEMPREELIKAIKELTESHERAMELLRKAVKGKRHASPIR